MKKKLLTLVLILTAILCIAQPPTDPRNDNGKGKGNGNCPDCPQVPLEFGWVLVLGGAALGAYYIKRKNYDRV